mgnify:FL=1
MLKVLNPLLIGGLKKFRSIEASQVAKAMIAIALMEDKTAVRVYQSDELASLSIPEKVRGEDGVVDKEPVFNWSKVNGQQDVLDEEVKFDRSKIKTVNREIE